MTFYVLHRRLWGTHDTEFIEADPVHLGDAPRCPACGAPIGMRAWLPPHRAELRVHRRGFGDIAFGPSVSFLISRRFADAFRAEGLRGLEGFEPVEIVRIVPARFRKGAPEYVHVQATISRAALDDAASGIVRSAPVTCDVCRSNGVDSVQRIVLEDSTWSGEDLFEARGLPGNVLTSERFHEFSQRHRLLNVTLVPAADYGIDHATGFRGSRSALTAPAKLPGPDDTDESR